MYSQNKLINENKDEEKGNIRKKWHFRNMEHLKMMHLQQMNKFEERYVNKLTNCSAFLMNIPLFTLSKKHKNMCQKDP